MENLNKIKDYVNILSAIREFVTDLETNNLITYEEYRDYEDKIHDLKVGFEKIQEKTNKEQLLLD